MKPVNPRHFVDDQFPKHLRHLIPTTLKTAYRAAESLINDNVIHFPAAAREAASGRRLIPARLQDARLAKRLNQTELANLVGVKRQSISAYEKGSKSPEPDTMAAIARSLDQPISYFTRDDLPTFGSSGTLFYRKVGQDTNRRNLACAVYSKWLGELAFSFEPLVNYPAVDLPYFEPTAQNGRYTDDEIEDMAEAAREHFGLGLGPISNTVRLLESKGVIVSRVEVQGENIEAFSFWQGDRPFIFLASDKASAARSRFDVSHELAHLCAHRWVVQEDIADSENLKAIEKEADRFAAAFLLPRKSFPNEVYSPRVLAFVDLKRRWKVAIQAMIYRCKDLGIFDDRQITNLYKEISRKKWRTKEPLDGPDGLEMEQPLLLRRVAELVIKAGKLPIDELKSSVAYSSDWIAALAGIPKSTIETNINAEYLPTLKSQGRPVMSARTPEQIAEHYFPTGADHSKDTSDFAIIVKDWRRLNAMKLIPEGCVAVCANESVHAGAVIRCNRVDSCLKSDCPLRAREG